RAHQERRPRSGAPESPGGRRSRHRARARRTQRSRHALHGRARGHDQEQASRRRAVPRDAMTGRIEMSSHREAPEISKDPVADSTDLYAFVSPDAPDTVTIIANYVPLQGPAGGPNFDECGDDVLYEIHVDNDGDAVVNVTYEFRFTTKIEIGGT